MSSKRALKLVLVLFLFWTTVCGTSSAQLGSIKSLAGGSAANSGTKTNDPLGRDTPRGTLMGFMQAAERGDNSRAAEYLQMPRQASTDSDRLVEDLQVLLNNAYAGRLGMVSDSRELVYDPQLPENHQRAGSFIVNGKDLPLQVVRVPDGNSGYIWLVSWTTLSRIGDLSEEVQSHEFEKHLPKFFVRHSFLLVPLWTWLAFVLMIPLALLAGLIAVAVARSPAWVLARWNHRAAKSEVWSNIRGPVLLFATAFAHAVGMNYARVPLLFREYYAKVLGTAMLFAIAWLLWDFVTLWTQRARRNLTDPSDRGTLSLTLLGHRVLKVLIATAALLSVMHLAGVDLTTALAGLGIGGIAVALAAQKTIENLFGGISILTDRVIRVGDLCRVGETIGTVEDIGLRSTRIRTYERGLISVPNGALAATNVENLSSRDKWRIFLKLGLRYETSTNQLRFVVAELRNLLYSHPRVEQSTAWVRVAKLADSGIELELQAYVLTREFNDFAAVREDILMHILEVVEASGTGLAYPSQTLYLGRDTGLDADRKVQAEQTVQAWREEGELPFPETPESTIRRIRGSVAYPPEGSAQAKAGAAGSE